jgi:hypothetical protein
MLEGCPLCTVWIFACAACCETAALFVSLVIILLAVALVGEDVVAALAAAADVITGGVEFVFGFPFPLRPFGLDWPVAAGAGAPQ